MSIRLLAFAATSLLPLWVPAADLPKQGSDTFTAFWVLSCTIQPARWSTGAAPRNSLAALASSQASLEQSSLSTLRAEERL